MTSKYGYLTTCTFLHAFSGSLCSSVLINPLNYSRLLAEPTELAKTRRWWSIVLWLGDLWRRESLRWQREKWCWLTWWWGPAWAPKLVPCPSKNWTTSSSLELRSFLRMRWKQHEPWVHVFFYHLHSLRTLKPNHICVWLHKCDLVSESLKFQKLWRTVYFDKWHTGIRTC